MNELIKLRAAAYIFEQENGFDLQDYQVQEIKKAGYENKAASILASEIINTLNSDDVIDSELRTTAYWALGKRQDKNLLIFFQESLNKEIDNDIRVAYQIMIVLEDLDEIIFGKDREENGYSFDEDELNRRDAVAYLSKL